MGPLLKLLATSGAAYLSKELFGVFKPVGPMIRRLSTGLAVVLSSVLAWMVSFFFMLLALFFYLGNVDAYSTPAFFTGVVSLVVALVLTVTGLNMMRRPL